MNQDIMNEEWYKKAKESDVIVSTSFFCKIGQVEAKLTMYIEPDPHGNGAGTHAHFHTPLLCPKTKIVEYPEPDRCQVTDQTCPFWEPVGGYQRDVNTRKWVYAHRFLHQASLIEFYGVQLLETAFKLKGFNMMRELPDMSYWLLVSLLHSLGLVNKDEHNELQKLREKRNRLAHEPRAYASFGEKELFELVAKAERVVSFMRDKISRMLE